MDNPDDKMTKEGRPTLASAREHTLPGRVSPGPGLRSSHGQHGYLPRAGPTPSLQATGGRHISGQGSERNPTLRVTCGWKGAQGKEVGS